MRQLRRLDAVAFVRYASVYLAVSSLDDLVDAMREISEAAPPPPTPGQRELFDAEP